MISSVSVYSSYKVTTLKVIKWLLEETNTYYYVVRSMIHVGMWICMMIILSKIPYTYLEKYVKEIFWVCFLMLFIVLFIWLRLNGARGWIDIPWVPFSLQPVEFMKIGLILMLAYFMKKKKFLLSSFSDGFVPFFTIVWSVLLLLAFQPDFWSILIIAPIAIALYYVWWWNSRYIWASLGICFIGALFVYGIGSITMQDTSGKNTNPLSYISKRIDNFMSNNKNAIANNTINYQTKQGLIAIGSGWFFGLGFWKSIQKFWYLPEVQWDFIFSVIIEELGFLWGIFLFCIYLMIAYKWFTIARSVKDPFWQYVAFGITLLIIVQAFINIWVNLNIIPLTGVTLPFVSYGWSSLFSLMIAAGILLSISRHAEYRPERMSDIFSGWRRVSI